MTAKQFLYSGLFGLSLLGGLRAQTLDDVSLFFQDELQGSPRFSAMGGAFSALGNDVSALNLNPAGVGVYSRNELSLGMNILNQNGRSENFLGGSPELNSNHANLSNLGLVLKLDDGQNSANGFSLGFTYNRRANFNRFYNLQGLNNFTLGEYWAQSAEGLTNQGMEQQGLFDELAAWQAYVLVEDSNGLVEPNGFAYGAQNPDGDISARSDLRYRFDQSGSLNDWGIQFGGQHQSKFYYGLALNFPSLNFRRDEEIREDLLDRSTPPYNALDYTYRRLNTINANGFNFQLGFIYRPIKALRLAASYRSNTWYTLNQIYETQVIAHFDQAPVNDGIAGRRNESERFLSDYSYRLRTPGLWRFGLAGVLFQRWSLSFDYSFQALNQSRLYTNRRSFGIDERILASNFQPDLEAFMSGNQQSFALGTELRISPKFLARAGYRYLQSQFIEEIEAQSQSASDAYSAGLGYRQGPWSFDISYSYQVFSQNQVLYRGRDGSAVLPDVPIDWSLSQFIMGLSYRF